MPARKKWVPYHVWLARRGKRRYSSSRRNLRGRGAYYGDSTQKIYGSGNYFTKGFRKAANYVKKEAKALAPGIFQGAARKAGQALITGFGDYHINSNSLIRGKAPAYDPSFGNGHLRVQHREYLGQVSASTAFSIGRYDINPGLTASFPWLAQIAQNFEQYRFRGLVYHYKSTTSDSIATATNDLGFGQVMMATDYDSNDPDYQSTIEMLNSMFANSTKPSNDLLHAVECAPDSQPYKLYFVRVGSLPANADIKTYDLGKFQFGTEGMATDYVGMGQLWCTYDVEFFKPQNATIVGTELITSQYFTSNGGSWEDNPFGTAQVGSLGNNFPVEFSVDGRTMVIPNFAKGGTFLMVMAWNGATPATVTIPTLKGNNVALKHCWDVSEMLTLLKNDGNVETFIVCFVFRVLTNEGNSYIAMETDGVFPTGTGQEGTIHITQVNRDVYEQFPETLLPN